MKMEAIKYALSEFWRGLYSNFEFALYIVTSVIFCGVLFYIIFLSGGWSGLAVWVTMKWFPDWAIPGVILGTIVWMIKYLQE